MERRNSLLFFVLFLFSFTGEVFPDNTCDGDWKPYKDEKCLKVFDTAGLVSCEEAESFCKQKYGANLVSIGVKDKQKFLENFLKSQGIVDYVWIGLKYESDDDYVWSDNAEFHYSNWASGSPKNDPHYCVQMNTDDAEFGKWVDVFCAKKNLVLCEKVQSWSLSQLQNEVMNIKQNLIPIGFIYVQLPKQTAPEDIWSWGTWKDVSSDYAGVFFRVEGGNAASFGDVQNQTSPRITSVTENYGGNGGSNDFKDTIDIYANNEYSSHVYSAVHYTSSLQGYQDGYLGLSFKQSADEVRPRNMAIRIWKRTQ